MSDEEPGLPGFSLSGFLKTFNGAAGQRSSDSHGPTAKAKAAPKASMAKAKSTPRGTPSAKPKPASSAAEHKVLVGSVASTKRKGVPSTSIDPFQEQSPDKKRARDSDDGISEADNATIDSFTEKISPLKTIAPPVADTAFKANLAEHLQKMSAVLQELRLKKKSAERRNGSKTNKADMLFLEKLSHIDAELKEMYKLVRCLAGQVSLDADKVLLNCLDEASSKYNMHFNSSVIRRALKIMVYEDLKLCAFTQMATTTYETIASRFTSESDELSCEDFFSMTCGQVLQKLAKTAQSKIRTKDRE
eukprot:Skav230908  [mRNA]  locus=scaffold2979:49241:50754:+ [translate_table: standard]